MKKVVFRLYCFTAFLFMMAAQNTAFAQTIDGTLNEPFGQNATSGQVPGQMSQMDDPPPGPVDPHDPCTDPLDYCPIDGGVVLLLVAGVGYGIKVARNSRK